METGNHDVIKPKAFPDLSAGVTSVKVQTTSIKYFDHAENNVLDTTVLGKLSVSECKQYVAALGDENIYISKEVTFEQFDVNTIELYNLKG